MGKISTRLPNFCLNRIRPLVRVRSPTIQSKLQSNSTNNDQKNEKISGSGEEKTGDGAKPSLVISRKIMIVVDSSLEAKAALQWALSHTVQNQDKLILLHVTKASTPKQAAREDLSNEIAPKAYDFVSSMRNMCQSKRPEVQTEVVVVEGKEKGPTIVEEARKQGVAMLVLGQKKRSTTWRLLMMWAGQRVAGGVVEYCIQNATCMAVAVRRKNRKVGGYLITTKRHKDFWLLA